MNIKSLFPFAFLLCFLACGGDTAPMADQIDLTGEWILKSAKRNNKVTQTLNGAYFSFSEDGLMKTNMLGTEDERKYSLEKSTILQDGVDGLRLDISKFNDSLMTLETEIRDFSFSLDLVKTQ